MQRKRLYKIGEFELNPSERSLTCSLRPVTLTPKAFDLLCFLAENAGHLQTRDTLLREVWEGANVENNRIDATVSEIRRALGGKKEDYIETIPKSGEHFVGGYRFKAPVILVEDSRQERHIPCPFPGLKPLDTKDAEMFFGRESEIKHLLDGLRQTNFLTVIGASGAGKSSLVRAGLLRELGHGALPHSETWEVRVFQPGSEPSKEFAAQLAAFGTPNPPDYVVEALLDKLKDAPTTITERVEQYLNLNPTRQRVLWVIDQFEEVFTQCRDEAQQLSFIESLLWLINNNRNQCSVILLLRADYYSAVLNRPQESFRELARQIGKHLVPVNPPDEADMRELMLKPAEYVGLQYEEGLVETILADLKAQPGALPLLAHTLLEIYNRRDRNLLTFAAYHQAGRVAGSIAKRADQIYESLSPERQRVTRFIMVRLSQAARIGEGLGETRQRVQRQDLNSCAENEETVERVIDTLTNARLIALSVDDRTGKVWVEVAHEALINHWPRLLKWLRQDRGALRIHSNLMRAANEWQARGRGDDMLFRGRSLSEAKRLREEKGELLSDLEAQFLEASVRLEELEQRAKVKRRWATRAALAGVAIVILLSGLVYAFWQQRKEATQQRDFASSLKLAAESITEQQIDPEVGLLLAIEAARFHPTQQAEAALRRALVAPQVQAILQGHTAQVTSVNSSPDGRLIVSSGADGTARIWGALTGELISTLQGHRDWLNSAVFSPDGNLILTASNDATAVLWSAKTGEQLRTFSGHEGRVNNAAFNPDGSLIVTAGGDQTARIWNARTGGELMILKGHQRWLNSAVFSPDGSMIATASGDNTARIWDARTGTLVKELTGHTGTVLNVAFSRDGQHLATSSSDKRVLLWETGSWVVSTELRGHVLNVNSAEFSPDGRWVITASKDGTARVWDSQTGQSVVEMHGHRSGINNAVFSPDGKYIYTASGDETARVWIVRIPQSSIIVRGHGDAVYGAVFSPNGRLLVTASSDATARVWDAETGEQVRLLQHPHSVQSAVFSPDDVTIATSSADGRVRIWEAATGALQAELIGHESVVHAVAFSSDGSLLASASRDRTVRIWDARTGALVRVLAGHTSDVSSAAFSHDRSMIVTASRDNTIRVWTTDTGESLVEWKIGTGFVNSASFNSNGRYVLAACGDQTARVWDLRSRLPVAVLRGHDGWVNYAEFGRVETLVVTASGDKTARIWDLSSGQILLQFTGHRNSVTGAFFSPDGRRVATASTDGTAQVFTCEVCGASWQELLRLAEGRTRRRLTPEERERFLRLSEQ